MAKEVSKSIGNRIKERRESLGLSQKDLAKLLNISYGAVGNYESGISSPREDIMLNLFNILKCDANYLFQDVVDLREEHKLSANEYAIIEKYRSLPPDGQKAVDLILDYEVGRMKSSKEKDKPQKFRIAARGGIKEIEVTKEQAQELKKIVENSKDDDYSDIF